MRRISKMIKPNKMQPVRRRSSLSPLSSFQIDSFLEEEEELWPRFMHVSCSPFNGSPAFIRGQRGVQDLKSGSSVVRPSARPQTWAVYGTVS